MKYLLGSANERRFIYFYATRIHIYSDKNEDRGRHRSILVIGILQCIVLK